LPTDSMDAEIVPLVEKTVPAIKSKVAFEL
jgi:hypothetical protein